MQESKIFNVTPYEEREEAEAAELQAVMEAQLKDLMSAIAVAVKVLKPITDRKAHYSVQTAPSNDDERARWLGAQYHNGVCWHQYRYSERDLFAELRDGIFNAAWCDIINGSGEVFHA